MFFCLLVAAIAAGRCHPLGGVKHSERAATVRPDEDHHVLPIRHAAEAALYVRSIFNRFTVDLKNHIAARQPGIVGWASRHYVSDDSAVNFLRSLQLFADIR